MAPANRPPTAAALYYMVIYTVPAEKRDRKKAEVMLARTALMVR